MSPKRTHDKQRTNDENQDEEMDLICECYINLNYLYKQNREENFVRGCAFTVVGNGERVQGVQVRELDRQGAVAERDEHRAHEVDLRDEDPGVLAAADRGSADQQVHPARRLHRVEGHAIVHQRSKK